MFFKVRHVVCVLSVLFLVSMLMTGCDEAPSTEPVHKIKILQGAEQTALPGEKYSKDLRIELQSAPKSSWLGLKKTIQPLANRRVRVVADKGSDLEISESEVTTDVAGMATIKIQAGKRTGDNYLRLIPVDDESKEMILRYIVGAKILGSNLEGSADSRLESPVGIRLQKPDGTPAVNVPVFFSVLKSPSSKAPAILSQKEARTDSSGTAQTDVKLGSGTGPVTLGVEVADQEQGYFIRQHRIQVQGIDILKVLITVGGGLALFIYGMKLMGDGLIKVSGESMKRMLQFFSRNRFVALLAGTLVTAIIQSSSATTVMVIGFINAGLLTLSQSIGIIFGANIGTTITAQIIAFNLDALSLPAITLGLVLLISKKRMINGWGETIFGFGLLFFGMTMMSTELKVLGNFHSFISLFQTFDCTPRTPGGLMPFTAILGAIVIGMMATFVIQSSSAAIGIILALAGSGLINIYTAVPLLIGTNIGTTITSGIASIPANRVAKQAALSHFLFNIIGSILILILLYIPYGPERHPLFLYFVNAMTIGDVFSPIPQGLEHQIAMAHTIFNVMTVIILIPFSGVFAHICEKIIPIKDADSIRTHSLEPLLLATPAVAIDQVIVELRKMVSDSWQMVDQAVNTHFCVGNMDPDSVHALKLEEDKIDEMQTEITNYLVQITRRELTTHQSGIVPLLMHCTNDAERIADHTSNILKLTKRLNKTGLQLSEVARKDLTKMWSLLNMQAANVIQALGDATDKTSIQDALENERKLNKMAKKYQKSFVRTKEAVVSSNPLEEDEQDVPFLDVEDRSESVSIAMQNELEINQLAKKYEQEHVTRRNNGQCAVESSVIFIEMIWELERIGDRLANIAVRTPEIQKHYFSI